MNLYFPAILLKFVVALFIGFILTAGSFSFVYAEECSGKDSKPPNPACTEPHDEPCDKNNPDYENPNCLSITHDQIDGGFKFPGSSFKSYGQGIITAGSGIILGIAILKIIFAGVMYATAAGNAQKIEDAKSHIYYALLGIALLVGMNVLLLLLGAEIY